MLIERRFNGPADSGNGGYTAGLVAETLRPGGGAAGLAHPATQVTLRRPPPLDTPLEACRTDAGVTVSAGADLVAEAATVELADDPVPPVSTDAAAEAARDYPGFTAHPFPTCFVCGPLRAAGDGLRIFPGPLPDRRTAAPWTVPADVSAVTVWAALDCPGGWAVLTPARPYVLGRITARVARVPAPGDTCVVMGAMVAAEGRKAEVRTALYGPTPAGSAQPPLLAQARATWIAV